jgi:hypothetical protein
MVCPLFVDFTRECAVTFKDVTNNVSFLICVDKEKHKKCPFYRIINNELEVCKFTNYCRDHQKYGALGIERISALAMEYCFCENRVNCAIHKLKEADLDIPEDLLADGNRLESQADS